MRASAALVMKRAATGMPVPSPQVNVEPFAAVNVIEPRRMKRPRKYRNNRSIETPTERQAAHADTTEAEGLMGVPKTQHKQGIGMRYCAVVKADIPKCDNSVHASWMRFHSRHNQLK